MFEIGFMELVLVGVVALIVVGPERLPGLARTTGAWVGRLRAFVGNIKSDIEKELKAEELKRLLEQQQLQQPLEQIIEETRSTVGELKEGVDQVDASLKDQSH